MGLTCWCFLFIGHVIKFDLTTNEGISIGHHLVQSRNCRISYGRSFGFHNRKDSGGNAQAIRNKHQQITSQAHQGEGKRK